MRVINSYELKQSILAERDQLPEGRHGDSARAGIRIALRCMEQCPAVDAEPVVHCKDCRYWGDADGVSTNVDGVRFARCRAHNHYVAGMHIGWCPAEDDFCSYGAREDGDSDA